ncbi:hypothetical protein jhhlp_000383 [Lomentospora prolificans]|uniref:LPXTG-domain-containing protein n=1 Tax=Lomentospora prolificans TaxID=41688 RepID=A0A2N3NKZ7_9PEZI|nr:hypothetical protein jhhlp_000383 [Lomentospora prolificans]
MMLQFVRVVTALLAIASYHSVLGFQVAPGSPCETICDVPTSPEATGNSSQIVCGDESIRSTAAGARMKACFTCLESSTHVNASETDQQWLLYNLRVTLGTCLFEVPPAEGEAEQTCAPDTKCSPLQKALFAHESEEDNGGYKYCDASDDGFSSSSLSTCTSCLESNKNEMYLLNFLNVVTAACVYKPKPGSLIVRSSLFSADGVDIVVPGGIEDEDQETEAPVAPAIESTGEAGLTQTQKIAIIASVAGTGALAAILFLVYFTRRRLSAPDATPRLQQQMPPPTNPYPIMTEALPQKPDEGASPSSYSTVSSFQSAWTVDPKFCSTATLSWTDVSGMNTTSSVPVHPAYVANIPGRKSNISDRSGNFV